MVKINRDNLFTHIPDENLITIKKIVDKMEVSIKNHEVLSTDFLNPFEVSLAESILNRFDINYLVDGGFENAERKIIYIYPTYLEHIEKNKISYISIEKNDDIKHNDVLGSILNLGIDRSKIGDIIFNDAIYIFVKNEQYDFIKYNLKKIKNINVNFINNVFTDSQKEYVKRNIIVSSLRLDNIICNTLNISRSKAALLIKSGKVSVNFKMENKVSSQISPKDELSVRGFGRLIFDNIEKTTKKGNFVVTMKFPK